VLLTAATPLTAAATIVVAHAAGNGLGPENTIPTIQNSVALGTSWVEIDVRMTMDGVPILMHDPDVDRTTDGTGLVADLTLAEIKALDAGSYFGPEFAGTQVPTLEEAIPEVMLGATPLLDIKDSQIAPDIAAVLATLGINGSDVVFWANTPAEVSAVQAEVPAGIIYYQISSGDETKVENAAALGVDGISMLWSILSPSMIEAAHTNGLVATVWGTNNLQNMATAMYWGIDGIHANFPDRPLFLIASPDCGDTVDNDLDGLIDFPNDPNCDSEFDPAEEALAAPVPASSPFGYAVIVVTLAGSAFLPAYRRR